MRTFLQTLPGPVVLVGHSYGGFVITNAATGLPNVKALVYINAFAPDTGETPFQLVGPVSALAVDPATVFDLVLPRLLAGLPVDSAWLAGLGHGGLLTRDVAARFPPYRARQERGAVD